MENNHVGFDESFGGDSKCDTLHSNPWQVLFVLRVAFTDKAGSLAGAARDGAWL